MNFNTPTFQISIAIVFPFFINLFLALYYHNTLSSVAETYKQVSHYEDLAKKAESGEIQNPNVELANLYRSIAKSDTDFYTGLKLIASSILFWVSIIIFTVAYQALLFFKYKTRFVLTQNA